MNQIYERFSIQQEISLRNGLIICSQCSLSSITRNMRFNTRAANHKIVVKLNLIHRLKIKVI